MRVAYLNSDPVNLYLAHQIASRQGAVICGLHPHLAVPVGVYDAVIYNVDDLSSQQRVALLNELCSGGQGHPVAAHGYSITEEQDRALRQSGVSTARRLDSGLVRSLIQALRTSRESVTTRAGSTDLTWVDLAR
jgi:hypothetical protein